MGDYPLAFAELAVVDSVRQAVYAFNKVTVTHLDRARDTLTPHIYYLPPI